MKTFILVHFMNRIETSLFGKIWIGFESLRINSPPVFQNMRKVCKLRGAVGLLNDFYLAASEETIATAIFTLSDNSMMLEKK